MGYATVDVTTRGDVDKLKGNAVGLYSILFLCVTGSAPLAVFIYNTPFTMPYGSGSNGPSTFVFATIVLPIFSIAYAEMAKKDALTFGIGMGGDTNSDATDTHGALFSAYGAALVDAKGNITLDTPDSVQAGRTAQLSGSIVQPQGVSTGTRVVPLRYPMSVLRPRA